MAEIARTNYLPNRQLPVTKMLHCKTLIGGEHALLFQLPLRAQRRWHSRLRTSGGHGFRQSRCQLGKASTYSAKISTDIPLYETPGASFDQYLEDKPRVFEAIFPDKRRSHRLSEEEWRIQMLPIDFLFVKVWPVVDMRLRCRMKGQDYPPGVSPDVSKVLELDILRWELQGLDDIAKPNHFSLGVKGSLYPDRRGPRTRLKGQLEMKISVILPQMFALMPQEVLRSVSESSLISISRVVALIGHNALVSWDKGVDKAGWEHEAEGEWKLASRLWRVPKGKTEEPSLSTLSETLRRFDDAED